jgi:hypothetical protein
MLQYARDTQHEKIIRGLAMGTAFIYYGRQEEADETIKLLLAEKVCPKYTKNRCLIIVLFRTLFFGTVVFMP